MKNRLIVGIFFIVQCLALQASNKDNELLVMFLGKRQPSCRQSSKLLIAAMNSEQKQRAITKIEEGLRAERASLASEDDSWSHCPFLFSANALQYKVNKVLPGTCSYYSQGPSMELMHYPGGSPDYKFYKEVENRASLLVQRLKDSLEDSK